MSGTTKIVTDIERVQNFVNGVLDGSIPSCKMVRRAVERFMDDLKREDLYFDQAIFGKFCKFSRQFKHYKGALAGQFFEPEDWQLFVFANCIGLRRVSSGRRKYRLADIYLPRKNGKTFIASIFALWFLLMDGEAGPEVYTAALDQEQAKLCYDAAAILVQGSIFAPWVKIMNSRVKMEGVKNHGVMKPLSKDTKNKDGLNIHAAVCDERHAWPNTEMLDVIKTGMGARLQPFVLSISTAGIDVSNPYFADIEAYKDEMSGVKPLEDDHFFLLYTPDEGDDWEDEDVWKKVNPNLGISLDWEYMRSTYNEAKTRGGTYIVSFKTKNLNMWVDAPKVWVPDEDVAQCNRDFDESRLEGEDCYVGIDLASKNDICATAFFFPRFKYVKFLFVLPEAKVENRDDRVDYRRWVEDGWITVCPGKVLDEDWYMERLFQEMAPFRIKSIAFDPWGMWDLKTKFGKYEDVLIEYQQNIRYMSVPTKRLESEVLKHNMNFGFNPVFRWMMRNVVVYIDPNANVKLDKARSRNKIDGVVATVDAVGGWLNVTNGETGEIYADHELRTFRI